MLCISGTYKPWTPTHMLVRTSAGMCVRPPRWLPHEWLDLSATCGAAFRDSHAFAAAAKLCVHMAMARACLEGV